MFQGWTRYRHSCYRVTSREQTHEDAMTEYYCQGPLLTVENRCFTKKILSVFIWVDSLFLTSLLLLHILVGSNRNSSTVC